jgi:hypothetical protein
LTNKIFYIITVKWICVPWWTIYSK